MSEEFTDFNISLSLDDVSAWGGAFEMIIPGTYILEVANVAQVTTKGGHDGIKFTFKVVSDDVPTETGKQTTKTYTLKADSKALGRFKNLMQALGLNPNQVRGGELLGKRFLADIKHTLMQGLPTPDGGTTEPKTMVDVTNEKLLPPDEDEASAAAVEAAPATAPAAAVRKPVAGAKGNGQVAAAARR